MLKSLALLTLAFSLNAAHANDGSIMTVPVLGIEPGAGVSQNSFDVYGNEVNQFAEILPITDVDQDRSATFVSDKWVMSISCLNKYNRPTNGEERTDWNCTFKIDPRDKSGYDEDIAEEDNSEADASTFTTYAGAPALTALGIAPKAPLGEVFKVYGNSTALFAAALPADGITLNSARYSVDVVCQQSYVRPITGETRNDSMCAFNILAK